MTELLNAAFSAVNIIPTLFLVFVIVYWMLVILGAIDLGSFDLEVDLDTDAGFDADAAADATGEASVSWLNNALTFFNIDKVPLMIFVSFWAFPLWVVSVITNAFFGNETFLISLIFLVPAMILCLFIAKPLTIPFVKVFANLNDTGEEVYDLLGRIGEVRLGANESKMGQADLNIEGASYRLNIRSKTGALQRGQQIMITNYIEEEGCYIAEPHETID